MNTERLSLIVLAAGLVAASPMLARPTPAAPETLAVQQDQSAQPQDQQKKDEKAKPQQGEERPKTSKPEEKAARPEEARPQERAPQTQSQEARPNQRPVTPRSQSSGQAKATQAHYQFRSQDVTTLRQHFQSKLTSVNRGSRPQLVVGERVPQTVVTYIEPVPTEVLQILPPPPAGYLIGFCDGYIIVYDPNTFFVVAVIDLL